MTTLTTNAGGAAEDLTLSLETGQRYVFHWGKDIINNPTTGTLSIKVDWQDAIPAIHYPAGGAATWDLSAVNSGAVEFAVAQGGGFSIAITGGGDTKTIHCALRVIP